MNYKAAIEAILFTMGESVELGRIADAIQLNEKETKKLLDELIKEYRSSSNIGMNIIELDGAYQMCTKPQMSISSALQSSLRRGCLRMCF